MPDEVHPSLRAFLIKMAEYASRSISFFLPARALLMCEFFFLFGPPRVAVVIPRHRLIKIARRDNARSSAYIVIYAVMLAPRLIVAPKLKRCPARE